MIIKYNIQKQRFNAQIILSRMKRGCLLKKKSGKERGMHLVKDVLAPSELVVGWRKVGMSWIKAKGEATSKTLESTSPKIIHVTQTSLSLGICTLTWRKVPNSKNSQNWQHLTCPSCPTTCQNDFPSHPTLFWQLSFIFLIAEFFDISFFLGFLGFSSNY